MAFVAVRMLFGIFCRVVTPPLVTAVYGLYSW